MGSSAQSPAWSLTDGEHFGRTERRAGTEHGQTQLLGCLNVSSVVMLDKANAGFSLNTFTVYSCHTVPVSVSALICALFNFTQCAAETTCLLFHQINALHQTLVQQTCLKERVQHLVNLLIMTIHLTCCLPLDTAEDVLKNYDLLKFEPMDSVVIDFKHVMPYLNKFSLVFT